MNVELISVGTEILMGNIVNTNAAYLAKECADLGLACLHQVVVGDNEKRLKETVSVAMQRADVLILTGGLGPTGDDLTKECCADLLGKTLIYDKEAGERLESFFRDRKRKMTENNLKQAYIPEGSTALQNDNGTAPGIFINEKNKLIFLLPGPPNEMIPMFKNQVRPILKEKNPEILFSKTVKICGIGESLAETMMMDIIRNQVNPTIAPYAKNSEVHFRVTAKAADETKAEELIQPVVKIFEERFPNAIYTLKEEVTLEANIIELLKEHQWTAAVAESCTGGLLGGRIVNVPGSSSAFLGGMIVYSNELKTDLLKVKKDTLINHGAVSHETSEEMAKNLLEIAKADFAVSITGIAGPDGGSDEKPIGLVYMSCATKNGILTREHLLKGNRDKIRETAVSQALILLRECILEEIKSK